MIEGVAQAMGWFCVFFLSLQGMAIFAMVFSGLNPTLVFSPIAAPLQILLIWFAIGLTKWRLRRS